MRLDLPGGHLDYALSGPEDAPLLLLNRPLGGSMALWGPFADALRAHFRLVAFDPRGVGASSDVALGHSTKDMAKDALALVDHVAFARRVHVFGISLGGMVASWMAVLAPERIDRLVLASTLPGVGALADGAIGELLSLAPSLTHREAEVDLVRAILSPAFRAAAPERLRVIEEAVRANPGKRMNLAALALAAARHGAPLDGATQQMRTLLLFGGKDPLAGAAAKSKLLRGLPRSKLVVLEDAGHDLTLEQPEETARHVIDFLAPARARGGRGRRAPS